MIATQLGLRKVTVACGCACALYAPPLCRIGTLPRPKHQSKFKYQTMPSYDDYASNILAATEAPIRDTNKEQVIMPTFSFEPIYRVLLYYNNWEDDRNVAKIIKQCVPIISYGAAKQVVSNARAYGNSIVVTAMQEDATKYYRNLLSKGLNVDIIEA